MATRKNKPTVIESADIAEMTNVPSGGWPRIQQGTHLTVKTFEDGKTELVWDWDALVSEIRKATADAELSTMKPAVQAKVITQRKKKGTTND